MVDLEKLDISLLNHLTTEIIVLDESKKVLLINDSAQANGWSKDSNDLSSFSAMLSPDTEEEIRRIINMAIDDRKSITKRDFELKAN